MRIGLNEVLNIVSAKAGIDKRYITFKAWFKPTDVDLGKDSIKVEQNGYVLKNFINTHLKEA